MTDITKDRDGEGAHPWIRTADGGRFYYLDMDGSQYNIKVAASALSRICRYAGHIKDAYEDDLYVVAQHSVYVFELLRKKGAPAYTYPWAITHDVPEAYFIDMPSPLKGLLPDYGRLEDESAAAFRDHFGIPFNDEIHDYVKWADYQMYFAERQVLTEIPPGEEDLTPAPEMTMWELDPSFFLWRPAYAKYRFLKAYEEAMTLYKESQYAHAS